MISIWGLDEYRVLVRARCRVNAQRWLACLYYARARYALRLARVYGPHWIDVARQERDLARAQPRAPDWHLPAWRPRWTRSESWPRLPWPPASVTR